jgi:hypothetical protein
MKRARIRTAFVVMMVSLLLISLAGSSAARNANPGVLPPNARVQGLSLGEWSAVWWQHTMAIPAAENPMVGIPWTDCYLGRVGNVGLGLAYFESGTTVCEMPNGMMLMMLVVGNECSTVEPDPFHGDNEAELRACVAATIFADLEASIDGVAVPDLEEHLVSSPMFDFFLPEDNIFGVPGGPGQSVSRAVWLMLEPLPPGQHSIFVHGSIPNFDFVYDRVYEVTVTDGQ